MKTGTEEELRAKYKIPDSIKCCISCHEDADIGERDIFFEKDGIQYAACCNVRNYLNDKDYAL